MNRLQIRRGIPFRICKSGKPKQVEWKVERLDSIEQQLTDSVAIARNGQRPGSTPSAAPSNVVPMPASTSSNTQPQFIPTTGQTVMSRVMASCLIAAMDAVDTAERYSAAKGIDREFTTEDIRTMASTILIQCEKAGMLSAMTEFSGGASKWQQ